MTGPAPPWWPSRGKDAIEVMDPWAVLGVDPTASYEEAHRAYVVRCQLLHPDRHQGTSQDVLAEAERATRELNEAWEAVRDQLRLGLGLAHAGTPTAGPPAERAGDVPTTVSDSLDWVLQRLIDAGVDHGEPLSAEEISRLRAPAATAPRGRRFDRWLQRRRNTLRLAIRDSEEKGVDRERWARVFRALADADVRVVLVLLIEQKPG